MLFWQLGGNDKSQVLCSTYRDTVFRVKKVQRWKNCKKYTLQQATKVVLIETFQLM